MADTAGFEQNVSSNPAVFVTVSTAGQQLLDSIAVFIAASFQVVMLALLNASQEKALQEIFLLGCF